MAEQFTALAEYYDRLNGADHAAYADFVSRVFKKYGSGSEGLLLDLGCGTGIITKYLASKGVKIAEFVRFEKGEGIEKKEDNFAEEVASMTK